jgi:hypothetical protein
MPEVACTKASDCPSGTICVLFYWQTLHSSCAYNVRSVQHAHHAPVCTSDADCKAALPRWQGVLGDEGYARALRETRCRPVPHDPAGRRACTITGFAAF